MPQPVLEANALLSRAKELLSRKDCASARTCLERVSAAFPDLREPYFWIGVALAEEGRQRRALSYLHRARRLGMEESGLISAMAYCHQALGELAAAERLLEEGLRRFPGTTIMLKMLANIAIKTGRHPQAAGIMHRALQFDGIRENDVFEAAQMIAWLEGPSQALPYFQRIIDSGIPDETHVKQSARLVVESLSTDPSRSALIWTQTLASLEDRGVCRRLPLSRNRRLYHFQDAAVGVNSQNIVVSGSLCRDFCFHLETGAPMKDTILLNPRFGFRGRGKTMRVEEACLFGDGRNYYHWMMDYLPGIGLLAQQGRLQSVPVILNRELTAYQRQSLEHIGFDFDRVLDPGDCDAVECGQLWAVTRYPNRPTHHFEPDWWHPGVEAETVEWLRRTFLPDKVGRRAAPSRRLFLSRQGARSRKLVGERRIHDAMERAGYEIIMPERLGFSEQIAMFAEASHIVGVHGAAFANMVFMAPGGSVLEIVGSYKRPKFYERLADLSGLTHSHLCADVIGVSKGSDPRFGDIDVEPEALRRHLCAFDPAFSDPAFS